MKRSGATVSYTREELAEMRARGESKTDWARLDTMTEEELEAAIASDPDEAGIVWSRAWMKGTPPPPPRKAISIRLDPDVLAFFRRDGRGYQTKINAVLRSYMEAMTRSGR